MRAVKLIFAVVFLLNAAMVAAALQMRRRYLNQAVDVDRVNAVGILGGYEEKVAGESFRGGYVRAVMGGVELDLSEAKLIGVPAVLEITILMGGADIRVPEAWKVSDQTEVTMGGVDIRARRASPAEEPDLILTGRVVMGGLEIR